MFSHELTKIKLFKPKKLQARRPRVGSSESFFCDSFHVFLFRLAVLYSQSYGYKESGDGHLVLQTPDRPATGHTPGPGAYAGALGSDGSAIMAHQHNNTYFKSALHFHPQLTFLDMSLSLCINPSFSRLIPAVSYSQVERPLSRNVDFSRPSGPRSSFIADVSQVR